MHDILEMALGELTEEEQRQAANHIADLKDTGFFKAVLLANRRVTMLGINAVLSPEGVDQTRQTVIEMNYLETAMRAIARYGVRRGEHVKFRKKVPDSFEF